MLNPILSTLSIIFTLHSGQADQGPGTLLKSAIEDFEFGERRKAASKLGSILNPLKLSKVEEVVLARQYLGACFFLLEQPGKSKEQFSMLLAVAPKHELDPAVFSPELVRFYGQVKKKLLAAKAPPPNGSKEPGGPKATEPVDLHSPILAIVPFGVGQFTNAHPFRGALFAIAELGLLGAAAGTFATFESLKTEDGRFMPGDAARADTLQKTYLATFWTGIAIVAIGIVEALISYPGDAGDTDEAQSKSATKSIVGFDPLAKRGPALFWF